MNVEYSYYDRATNDNITPDTLYGRMIDPVGQVTVTISGKRYAALVPLYPKQEKVYYRRTLFDIFWRVTAYREVTLLDLETAKIRLDEAVRRFATQRKEVI